MSYIMIDVEADGPIPGDYSMIALGAVLCSDSTKKFKALIRPISKNWIPEALQVSGYTREDTENFPDPLHEMQVFLEWIQEVSDDKLMFISDNNGFDWQFVNYYFHHFLGENPFGHSSTNLGSLYKGLVGDTFKNFKHLRKTRHTHDPIDDALGNVEALMYMKNEMGLRIKL